MRQGFGDLGVEVRSERKGERGKRRQHTISTTVVRRMGLTHIRAGWGICIMLSAASVARRPPRYARSPTAKYPRRPAPLW